MAPPKLTAGFMSDGWTPRIGQSAGSARAPLPGGNDEDSASDAALARHSDVIEPVAAGLVQPGGVPARSETGGADRAGFTIGLVRPSTPRSTAVSELKESPVALTPRRRLISCGPSVWQTRANTNGFATLMMVNP